MTSTFCHATYLINLATPDPELAAKSRACLNANLATAEGIGADGLVLHIGSHRGSGFDTSLPGMWPSADRGARLGRAGPGDPCPILLENAAGAGDTVGRSFEELAEVIEAAGDDERLGVCLDTQHLWASGIPFATIEEADELVEPDLGHGRSRSAALHPPQRLQGGASGPTGTGTRTSGTGPSGTTALAALLGHPDLQGLPAVLEVPGDGDGPRAEDVKRARRVWTKGVALRE